MVFPKGVHSLALAAGTPMSVAGCATEMLRSTRVLPLLTLIGRGCARRDGSDHWLVIARFPWREYADIIKASGGH
jgi:hypothetical protein